jgi:1-phosphofructokinase
LRATTGSAAACRVVARNTAGAGDALLAGWLAGGDSHARLARAVRWGRATCLAATTVADPAALAAAADTEVRVRTH